MITKKCIHCQLDKNLTDYYSNKDHTDGKMSYCKNCFNIYCMKRWTQRKIEAVLYKGNKCEDCKIEANGTNYCIFDFHHLDPKEKDYDWSKLRLKSIKSIEQELDKCALLCSNCHRIRHYSV